MIRKSLAIALIVAGSAVGGVAQAGALVNGGTTSTGSPDGTTWYCTTSKTGTRTCYKAGQTCVLKTAITGTKYWFCY